MFDPSALCPWHGVVRVEDEKGREYDIISNGSYRFSFRRVKKKWQDDVSIEDLPPKLYQRIV